MKANRRHRNAERLAVALMAAAILGLIIRLTVKDRWGIVAPVFYGLPPLVVVAVLPLNHIWLSEYFVPLRTRHPRTFRSDLALVIADVQIGGARK